MGSGEVEADLPEKEEQRGLHFGLYLGFVRLVSRLTVEVLKRR